MASNMILMNLLFDFDGTLADSYETFSESVVHAFNVCKLDPPSPENLRKCIGLPLHESLISILKCPVNMRDELLRLYREHHETILHKYSYYPGVEPVLKIASKNHKLYLATSKKQSTAEALLKKRDWKRFFSGIYGAIPERNILSKSEVIRELLRLENLDLNTSLMIGDREHDVFGAQENGIRCIGVLWGFGSKAELDQAGAVLTFQNWPELGTWLLEREI